MAFRRLIDRFKQENKSSGGLSELEKERLAFVAAEAFRRSQLQAEISDNPELQQKMEKFQEKLEKLETLQNQHNGLFKYINIGEMNAIEEALKKAADPNDD